MESDHENFEIADIKCQLCTLRDKPCDKKLPTCGDCLNTQHRCIYGYQRKNIKKELTASKIALIQEHKDFLNNILEKIDKVDHRILEQHDGAFSNQSISNFINCVLEHLLATIRIKREHSPCVYFYRFDGSTLLALIILLKKIDLLLYN